MKTILIIEDDEILRSNTAELLELSNYKVITAANGALGIEKAKEHIPDLIICDIMMPETDGYEVLEALTADESTKYIPFIFLSAKTKHKEVRKGMDMGADDYLTKPFDEVDLLSSIESRIEKSQLFLNKSQELNAKEEEEHLKDIDQLKAFFHAEGKVKNFKKNEVIYEKGDRSNQLYLILKGLVKTHIIDINGKELITGLYKTEDFLGFTSFDKSIPFNEYATDLQTTEFVGISK